MTSISHYRTRIILRASAALILGVVFVCSWLVYGPHIVDDAYITFRYAWNLAKGNGLVYNPGIRVQGSSTPLFSLLLGAAGFLGMDIPAASLVIGAAGSILTGFILIFTGIRTGKEEAGWLAAFALHTQLVWILLCVSGMETMLYSAFCLMTLSAVSLRRWKWTGILAGFSCLVRYDGFLLALAALAIAWKEAGRKTAFRELGKAAALYLPWFIFAWIYFGTPIPQSVKAKTLINVISWKALPGIYRYYIALISLAGVWIGLSIIGNIVLVKKDSSRMVIPFWMILFLWAFIIERRQINFYPWYLAPLLAPLFFTGAVGMGFLITRLTRFLVTRWGKLRMKQRYVYATLFTFFSAGIILFHIHDLILKKGIFGADAFHRERKYKRAARILSKHIQAGETVYVGELGTMGWFLPEAHIIDSAGIVSPEVCEIRKRDRTNLIREGLAPEEYTDGSEDVTRMVIRELKPDYITAKERFLFLEELSETDFFRKRYREIEKKQLKFLEQRAFERRRNE